tara:strand:+ start:328 stop:639 length:312 start_codon:yes stop_codon:yes gene_type:complete
MKLLQKLVSVVMGIILVGGCYAGTLYGANLWILLPSLISIYLLAVITILFGSPIVLFIVSLLISSGVITLFTLDAQTALWALSLGLTLSILQYVFWIRVSKNE